MYLDYKKIIMQRLIKTDCNERTNMLFLTAIEKKLRKPMPIIVMLRQRLEYALTYRGYKMICTQRLIKVDGNARSDMFSRAVFMDVVAIGKKLRDCSLRSKWTAMCDQTCSSHQASWR